MSFLSRVVPQVLQPTGFTVHQAANLLVPRWDLHAGALAVIRCPVAALGQQPELDTLFQSGETRFHVRRADTLSLLLGKPHEVAAGLVGPSWDCPSSQQGRA